MLPDKREPGVYVSIEDASYVGSNVVEGRSVFCVGSCLKGPHNRIKEIHSHGEFLNTFGPPDFRKTSMSHYCMDNAMRETDKGLYIRLVPEDAQLANCIISADTDSSVIIGSDNTEFTFKNKCCYVNNINPTVFHEYKVGEWIYSSDDTQTEARQIIAIDYENNIYTLNAEYCGTSGTTSAFRFNPYHISSQTDLNQSSYPVFPPTDCVYQFYALGAGSYYNNLHIKGVRNSTLEKMYMTESGDVKFKFLFMDIAIYETQKNGVDKLMEGPWTVSLTKETPDGMVIRNLTNGNPYYIEHIINEQSTLINMIVGSRISDLTEGVDEDHELARSQIMLLLSHNNPVSSDLVIQTPTGAIFQSGSDGTSDDKPLYDNNGNLQLGTDFNFIARSAYDGSLQSFDGSIEQIREVTYPLFNPDYIITGGWPIEVQDGGRLLASIREDVLHIGDTGPNISHNIDLKIRKNEMPWNNWTSMLYTQFRTIKDIYTNELISISPVYHAIAAHLRNDRYNFMGNPVAGYDKGMVIEPIDLMYRSNHTGRGDLGDAQLNCTITEPDGKYFLTQLTTHKTLSILQRAHVAKFLCFVRKSIRPLLKPLLQKLGTPYNISIANMKITQFLNTYLYSQQESRKILDDANVSVQFDDSNFEINVYLSLKFIRVIEHINVYIAVS